MRGRLLVGLLTAMACGHRDAVVRLDIAYQPPRRAPSSQVVAQLGHYRSPSAMAVSPGGGLLATATDEVRLWDARSGQLRAVRPTTEPHHRVTGLAFHYDPTALVIAREDGSITRWNLVTDQVESLAELDEPPMMTERGAFAVRGTYGAVMGWTSMYSERAHWRVDGRYDGGRILATASSSWDDRFMVADDQGTIFYGNPRRPLRTVHRPQDPSSTRWKVAVSESGRRLAAASGGDVVMWETREWRPRTERTLLGFDMLSQRCGCLSEGADILAMKFFDEELVTIDTQGMISIIDHEGESHPLGEAEADGIRGTLATFSRRGSTLAYATLSGWMEVYDLRAARHTSRFRPPPGASTRVAIALSPEGDRLAVIDGSELQLWDLARRTIQTAHVELPYGSERLDFVADGRALRVWSAQDGERTITLRGDEPPSIEDVAAPPVLEWPSRPSLRARSADGRRQVAFIPSYDEGLPHRLVSRKTTGGKSTTRAIEDELYAMELSPDGYVLAALDAAQNVWLFEAETLRLMTLFRSDVDPDPHFDPAFAVYTPDGSLAYDRPGGGVVLVDLDHGRRTTLAAGTSIYGLTSTQDGRLMALAGEQSVWLVGTDDDGGRRTVALVPNGDRLGVTRADGVGEGLAGTHGWIRLGSPFSGRLVAAEQAPEGFVRDELLPRLLAGRAWEATVDAPVPAEVAVDYVFGGHRGRYSAKVFITPGSAPVDEVCVIVDTVEPVDEHRLCVSGEGTHELRVPGDANIIRAWACEADDRCTRPVVEQWPVHGEQLLPSSARRSR